MCCKKDRVEEGFLEFMEHTRVLAKAESGDSLGHCSMPGVGWDIQGSLLWD